MGRGRRVTDLIPRSIYLQNLYDRAASIYVEMLDGGNSQPRLPDIARRMKDDYPEEQETLSALRTDEFSDVLKERRKTHIVNTLAPRYLMAEMGAGLGAKAAEEIQRRLEYEPESVSMKDLVAVAKLSTELTAKVDKEVGDAVQPSLVVNNAFFELANKYDDPEQKQAFIAEITRRAALHSIGGGKA